MGRSQEGTRDHQHCLELATSGSAFVASVVLLPHTSADLTHSAPVIARDWRGWQIRRGASHGSLRKSRELPRNPARADRHIPLPLVSCQLPLAHSWLGVEREL